MHRFRGRKGGIFTRQSRTRHASLVEDTHNDGFYVVEDRRCSEWRLGMNRRILSFLIEAGCDLRLSSRIRRFRRLSHYVELGTV